MLPEVEEKRGKNYLSLKNTVFDFTTTRLFVQFDNLFNGDKVLGETTNSFLNENWSEILMELQPVLRDVIGDIITAIVGPVFAKFPYDQLFLPNDASSTSS